MWNGISDATQWLYDKISGFVSGVLDKIKSFFGISSPSKETAWFGEMLGEGLAEGIVDSTDAAVTAAEQLSEGILGAMDSLSEDMQNAIPDSFDLNASANVTGALSGSNAAYSGATFGSLISIAQMTVRNDEDIRSISQELYSMIQSSSRAQGIFAVT